MPRPKGSKNKKKALADQPLEALIAQENEKLEALTQEKAELEAALAEQNAKLRDIKAQMKKCEQLLLGYREEQTRREAVQAAEAAKEALQTRIDELLAQGVSLDDILGKLD